MEILTSSQNPKIRQWRSLLDKKGRELHRAFLVEGNHMVEEALLSDFEIQAILLRNDYSPAYAWPDDVPVYSMPEHVFQSLCETKTPQGIAAVLTVKTVPEANGRHLIALDGLQDPGNVGTIIRTADAAGFDGVILSRDCADLFSPKVLRATMGSLFHLGFSFPASLPEYLMSLKQKGYSLLSSQLDGESFYDRKNVSPRQVLIVGNEGNGISEPVKAVATHSLCLPMRGRAESLNAAVAAGIMMYELMRREDTDFHGD